MAAGASCTINVVFALVQQGNVTDKLSMALDGKPAAAGVELAGWGQ